MKCGYCGADLPRGAKKCKQCFARVENAGQENYTSANESRSDNYQRKLNISDSRPSQFGKSSMIDKISKSAEKFNQNKGSGGQLKDLSSALKDIGKFFAEGFGDTGKK